MISQLRNILKASIALISLSAICGTIILSAIFIPSNGNEPRDICIEVEGAHGFLPINPNEGGNIVYSCDIKWDLAVFYIAVFGLLPGAMSFFVFMLIMRAVHRKRR